MEKNRILRYFLALFLISLGVLIGIAIYRYHNIPALETINIIDMATLITTVFLAVYIPEVLDRQLQIKRDKKGLIEQRIGELQTFYRRINILVQQDTRSPKDEIAIKNTLDVCESRFATIITLLTVLNIKPLFDKEIEEIKRICKEHKDLLWKNHCGEYTDEMRAKEELLYNQIDEKTCLLIFRISDS